MASTASIFCLYCIKNQNQLIFHFQTLREDWTTNRPRILLFQIHLYRNSIGAESQWQNRLTNARVSDLTVPSPFKDLHCPKSTNLTKVNTQKIFLPGRLPWNQTACERDRQSSASTERKREDTDMRNHDRRAQHWWHRGGNGWNNPAALDASWSTAPRICPAGYAQHWWEWPCKYRHYSQKLISFYIFLPADFDWPSKKGSFSEAVLFTFLKCYDTFSQGTEGPKPYKFGTAKKAQTLKYKRKREILHTPTWACTVFHILQEASLDHKSAIIFSMVIL